MTMSRKYYNTDQFRIYGPRSAPTPAKSLWTQRANNANATLLGRDKATIYYVETSWRCTSSARISIKGKNSKLEAINTIDFATEFGLIQLTALH